MFKFIMK